MHVISHHSCKQRRVVLPPTSKQSATVHLAEVIRSGISTRSPLSTSLLSIHKISLPVSNSKLVLSIIKMAEPSIKVSINDLPVEILGQILSLFSCRVSWHSTLHRDSQSTLHACVLVSRLWYNLALEYLYRNPNFTSSGSTFQSFVNTICPSVNAHVKKSGCASMVRKLDMSRLVHEGSKSLTARILGRCKTRLEEFTAPQASFAYVSHH